jgi:hypothetical protein
MTCHDIREHLSALLDDALGPAERQPIEAHLATCPECRRELAALRATVTLLGRLPAARAPAGFVDRIMAVTHRPPWPRRVLDALFVPLRVKLPLEAVAVVLVSLSALYVYQRAPEVQELERPQAREPVPVPPVARPAPSTSPAAPSAVPDPATSAPGAKDRSGETKRKPAPPPPAREEPRQPASGGTLPAPSRVPPEARDAARPAAPPATALSKKEQEASADLRADAPVRAPSAPASDPIAKSAESPALPDASGRRPDAAPSKPSSPAAVAPPRSDGPGGGSASRSVAPAPPPAPPAERPGGETAAAAKAPIARRQMRAVDASGRLVVPAREPAETALDALLGRVGGRRVERRLEGDRGLIVIDVLVPGARYRELIEGLGDIGRWVTEHEPRTFPAQLRVEVALTVEP